jgi:hypothetical protein
VSGRATIFELAVHFCCGLNPNSGGGHTDSASWVAVPSASPCLRFGGTRSTRVAAKAIATVCAVAVDDAQCMSENAAVS